jgi:Mn2+/Fe2+ NRAMP family transporter
MKNLLKTLGPGILFASTAIGVSHLVQSTRAGAEFGFTLLWAIILANLFKYPFFEYGSRYANATGESIISGYRRLGRIPIWFFFFITIVSMFLVTSAVGNVTAGFMQNLFGISSAIGTVAIIFVICFLILISNNFSVLDRLIKVIGIVLLVSTLIAFVMVLIKGPMTDQPLMSLEGIQNKSDYIAFLIPLMGWMPTALDLSAWNSLWTVARIKESGYHPSLKETKFDFNLGYLLSALLAICFVTLGAYIMFGSGKVFSNSGATFSGEVIDLYTATFGSWAEIIISSSAFSIMFGTCIAVFDGFSRAMTATLQNTFPTRLEKASETVLYRLVLIILTIGSFFIIYIFQTDPNGFLKLVKLATTVSFIIAPAIAVFNYILVGKKYIPASHQPNLLMRILSILGIIFLSIFTIFFIFQEQLSTLLFS